MIQDQNQERSPVAGLAFSVPGSLSPHRLTIPGRMPGLNEFIAACNSAYGEGHRMKQEHMHAAMWQIKAQLRGVKFTKPVFLLFTFYERDRRRDKDNVAGFAHKAIQDALVQCKTIQDDGWDYVTGHLDLFKVDRNKPRIEVQFIEQEEEPKCKEQRGKSSKK